MSKITDGLLRQMCKCRVSSLAQRYREEIMVSKDVACRRCYRQIASAKVAQAEDARMVISSLAGGDGPPYPLLWMGREIDALTDDDLHLAKEVISQTITTHPGPLSGPSLSLCIFAEARRRQRAQQ